MFIFYVISRFEAQIKLLSNEKLFAPLSSSPFCRDVLPLSELKMSSDRLIEEHKGAKLIRRTFLSFSENEII